MDIRVATYNFYCRPRWTFWDNQIIRAKLLAKEIVELEQKEGKKIDVLCLQEIVDDKVHKMLKKELKKIGFIFKSKRLDESWRLNGGIITYSRCPIIEQKSMVFKLENSYIWNAPAAKGAVSVKVMKNGKYYHIVNTHLDSFDADFRKTQMKNMNDWLDEQYIPEDESIIVCGDFNIDYYNDEINNVDEIFEYQIAELDAKNSDCEHSIIHKNDWVSRRITSKNDPDRKAELLDFFIYDSDDIEKATMKIVSMKHCQKAHDIIYSSPFFFNILTPWRSLKVDDMSDHYLVMCDFKH